jgi:hypothetical protein
LDEVLLFHAAAGVGNENSVFADLFSAQQIPMKESAFCSVHSSGLRSAAAVFPYILRSVTFISVLASGLGDFCVFGKLP